MLKASNGRLYAGVYYDRQLRGEVWAYDGAKWEAVGQPRSIKGQLEKGFCSPYSMTVMDDSLIIGFTSRKQDCLFSFNGKRWLDLAGKWIEDYVGVYEIWRHDGFLSVGMYKNRLGNGHVYRYDGKSWEKVGGDGIRGSWINKDMYLVEAFASYQGRLIASLTRYPAVPGSFSSVWAFDGDNWKPIELADEQKSLQRIHNYNSILVYKEHLYIGVGGYPDADGKAGVWELSNGDVWLQVGGNGIFGSWTPKRPMITQPGGGMEYVYRMIEYDGTLVVGFGDSPGMAKVWQYRPASD